MQIKVLYNCFFLIVYFNFKALFGESAGASAISFHVVSEMSKGLFHKVILMSGTIYSPWAMRSISDWSHRLGRQLGWDGEGDDKACFKVIQSASPENIIRAQEKLLTLEVFYFAIHTFFHVIFIHHY